VPGVQEAGDRQGEPGAAPADPAQQLLQPPDEAAQLEVHAKRQSIMRVSRTEQTLGEAWND